MPEGLLRRSLKKLGAVKGVEEVYRKGVDEGFQQGYWKARAELDTEIKNLKAEIEAVKSQYEVHEDQINLLGRLIGQLSEKQEGSTEEMEILGIISKLLKANTEK